MQKTHKHTYTHMSATSKTNYEEVDQAIRLQIAGQPLRKFVFDSTSETCRPHETADDLRQVTQQLQSTSLGGNCPPAQTARKEIDPDTDQIAWDSVPKDLRAMFDTQSLTVSMCICLLNSTHCHKLSVELFSDTVNWRTLDQWKSHLQRAGLFHWKCVAVPVQTGGLPLERHFFTLKKIKADPIVTDSGGWQQQKQQDHREKFTQANAEDYTVCTILFTKQRRQKLEVDSAEVASVAHDPFDRALRENLCTPRTVLQIVEVKFQWYDFFEY